MAATASFFNLNCLRRYQLQAVEWMKLRESVKEEGNDFASVDSQNLKVSLPIEGVLRVAGWDHSTSDLELWTPMFGLPIQCPERVNGQFIAPDSVCYYGEDVIETLLSDHRLLSFWFVYSPSLSLCDYFAFRWNRYTQTLQLEPPSRPKQCRGGILADEMGLYSLHSKPLLTHLLRSREDDYDDCVNRR
jgi:hypothetical protein